MGAQLTIDFARARRRDPLSSHAAADRAEASGAIGRQAQRVLEAVRATGGLTSAELAARHGLDRHAVARRCPELERRGLVRREEIGAREVRWWPADALLAELRRREGGE